MDFPPWEEPENPCKHAYNIYYNFSLVLFDIAN